MGDILQVKILERLREAESEVYSPTVQVSYVKNPKSRYSINVVFGCAPQNVDHLIEGVSIVMDELKQKGISDEDILKFKAAYSKNVELALNDNGFWLNYLAGQYENDEKPLEVLDSTEMITKVNAENLKGASKLFFDQKNLIKFVLLPESLKAK